MKKGGYVSTYVLAGIFPSWAVRTLILVKLKSRYFLIKNTNEEVYKSTAIFTTLSCLPWSTNCGVSYLLLRGFGPRETKRYVEDTSKHTGALFKTQKERKFVYAISIPCKTFSRSTEGVFRQFLSI